MSKKTASQEAKEIAFKQLKPEDLGELKTQLQLVRTFAYLGNLIEKNSALVPEGQKEAEKYKAISALAERARQDWLAQTLRDMGYTAESNVFVNLDTGVVQDYKPSSL